MKNTLEQYVAQHNSWQKIFDKAHVDIDINNMSKLQADELIRKLDGEITHSQAQAKYDYYMGVWEDLKEVYADKQWALPPVWELA